VAVIECGPLDLVLVEAKFGNALGDRSSSTSRSWSRSFIVAPILAVMSAATLRTAASY
jgi:hypothetical protein